MYESSDIPSRTRQLYGQSDASRRRNVETSEINLTGKKGRRDLPTFVLAF